MGTQTCDGIFGLREKRDKDQENGVDVENIFQP